MLQRSLSHLPFVSSTSSRIGLDRYPGSGGHGPIAFGEDPSQIFAAGFSDATVECHAIRSVQIS